MNAADKPSSPATRALWVIAFSLILIAVCLVILVCRLLVAPSAAKVSDPKPVAGEASESAQKLIPPLMRNPLLHPTTHHMAAAELPATANVADPVPVPAQNTAPTVPAAGAPGWHVSGGLAPLTALVQTNGLVILTGRVTLKGTPPPEKVYIHEAQCGKSETSVKTTHRYVVSTNGGLANVFVWIKSGLEGKRFPTPAEPAVLNQTGCEYEPFLLGLMPKQSLIVRNSDPISHNVRVAPVGSLSWYVNSTLSRGAEIEKRFAQQEVLAVRCDIHPWMSAAIFVTGHPFHCVTDLDGNYAITNVPPGDYVLEACHVQTPSLRETQTVSVKVRPDGTVEPVDFVFEATSAPGQVRRLTAKAR